MGLWVKEKSAAASFKKIRDPSSCFNHYTTLKSCPFSCIFQVTGPTGGLKTKEQLWPLITHTQGPLAVRNLSAREGSTLTRAVSRRANMWPKGLSAVQAPWGRLFMCRYGDVWCCMMLGPERQLWILKLSRALCNYEYLELIYFEGAFCFLTCLLLSLNLYGSNILHMNKEQYLKIPEECAVLLV